LKLKDRFNALISTFLAKYQSLGEKKWLFVSQIVGAVATIVLSKLLANFVDVETYGSFILWFNATVFFETALVIPLSRSYNFSFTKEKDVELYRQYFSLILLSNAVFAAIYLGIGLIQGISALGLVILVAYVFLKSVFTILSYQLGLLEKYYAYSVALILSNLVAPLVLGVMVLCQPNHFLSDFAYLPFLYFMAFGVAAWQAMRAIKKYFPHYLLSDLQPLSVLKERARLLEIYKFIRPLIIFSIFSFLINQSDKYIVDYFLSAREVAFYSAGYGLASKVYGVFVIPLAQILQTNLLELKRQNLVPAHSVAAVFRFWGFYMVLLVPATLLIYIFRNEFGLFFLSPTYAPAFEVIPVVALAYLFLTSCHFWETSFYAWGKTNYVLYYYVIGSLMNLGFNVLLIPKWGFMGAAYATLFSFMGLFVMSLLFYRRQVKTQTSVNG
jgi:O-antigen/teichoic acid export membrane protein